MGHYDSFYEAEAKKLRDSIKDRWGISPEEELVTVDVLGLVHVVDLPQWVGPLNKDTYYIVPTKLLEEYNKTYSKLRHLGLAIASPSSKMPQLLLNYRRSDA